ncbi:MAG: DNA repair protein RecN [Spirochaetaceae bacterium]
MLEELSVANYALIDDIQVTFSKGLNVLSGETGAGKSLLVGALGLIFGKKASPSYVRQGCDEASVSALVDLEHNPDAKTWLLESGINYEDNQILIKRNIKNSGRGSQYIENQGVTRSQLEEFSALLFDMHGQHEHQSLFSKVNHRKLLDKYGHLTEQVITLYNKFQDLTQLRKQLTEFEEGEVSQDEKISSLKKSIIEIEEASLIIGEEEELDRELKLLRNNDNINSLLGESLNIVSGNKGVVAKLKELSLSIDSLSGIDDTFEPLLKRIKDSYFEIDDISEALGDYHRNSDFSPELLQKKEDRLTEIFNLQKKYGTNVEDVLKFVISAKKELEEIGSGTKIIDDLRAKIKDEQNLVLEIAKELSNKRNFFAREMEEKVVGLLKQLSLPNVRFIVNIEPRKDNGGKTSCGPWGMDEIEFMMSMNPGEPLKPVKQIASGGEISRIMLALKSVLADVDNVGCLIFDEIDSGIGGEVALSIGDHLKLLSKNKQILSITHLASIASYGENHLQVIKSTDGLKTKTEVIKLEGEERVREIARMLSGECNEASLNHARELLGSC